MQRSRFLRAAALALGAALVLSLCGIGTFAQECDGIRQEVLRLHILANSDSEEDQALKLQVRDAVVAAGAGLLDGVTDTEKAERTLRRALPQLTEVAQTCVREHGYAYPVKAELCRMYFTTRVYDSGTLPAGRYTALRITIGEAAGHNWWCVVYPSMCLAGAGDPAQWSDVLDPAQTDIVEHPDRYEIRFKIVEWMQSLWESVSDFFR